MCLLLPTRPIRADREIIYECEVSDHGHPVRVATPFIPALTPGQGLDYEPPYSTVHY